MRKERQCTLTAAAVAVCAVFALGFAVPAEAAGPKDEAYEAGYAAASAWARGADKSEVRRALDAVIARATESDREARGRAFWDGFNAWPLRDASPIGMRNDASHAENDIARALARVAALPGRNRDDRPRPPDPSRLARVDFAHAIATGHAVTVVFDRTADKFDDALWKGGADQMGTIKGGESYDVLYVDGKWTATGYNKGTKARGTWVYTGSEPTRGELNIWGRVYTFDIAGRVYDPTYGHVGHLAMAQSGLPPKWPEPLAQTGDPWLSGTWKTPNNNEIYEIKQTGTSFTWYRASVDETAQGRLSSERGDRLEVSWSGKNGTGKATARVTEFDSRGLPSKFQLDYYFLNFIRVQPK